jgi:hypothetical protein
LRDFSEFLGKHVTQAAKDAVLEEPIGTAEGADEWSDESSLLRHWKKNAGIRVL